MRAGNSRSQWASRQAMRHIAIWTSCWRRRSNSVGASRPLCHRVASNIAAPVLKGRPDVQHFSQTSRMNLHRHLGYGLCFYSLCQYRRTRADGTTSIRCSSRVDHGRPAAGWNAGIQGFAQLCRRCQGTGSAADEIKNVVDPPVAPCGTESRRGHEERHRSRTRSKLERGVQTGGGDGPDGCKSRVDFIVGRHRRCTSALSACRCRFAATVSRTNDCLLRRKLRHVCTEILYAKPPQVSSDLGCTNRDGQRSRSATDARDANGCSRRGAKTHLDLA